MTTIAPAFDQPSTWIEMLQAIQERQQRTDERPGQAAFNAVALAWPEVAQVVGNTIGADPFYAEKDNDPRMIKFIELVRGYFI